MIDSRNRDNVKDFAIALYTHYIHYKEDILIFPGCLAINVLVYPRTIYALDKVREAICLYQASWDTQKD